MKTGWMIGGALALVLATGGIVYAIRSGGPTVPPKPKGLGKYDSEAFDYRGLVIVIDRRRPDTNPNKWRWRIFDRKAYGDGREIEGQQRATQFGRASRGAAYREAVEFIDEKILKGK